VLNETHEAVKEILEDALSAPVYVAILVDRRVKYPELF